MYKFSNTTFNASKLLHGFVKQHVPQEIKVQHIVAEGTTYKEVLATADKINVDLIIMGAHRPELNLEKSVESRKSIQDLDAPDKIKNTLFTNQVTTVFLISPCTSISCTSFSRSTDFSRLKDYLLGPNAERVVRHSPRSVLVVRDTLPNDELL